jgi:hypothetical protein
MVDRIKMKRERAWKATSANEAVWRNGGGSPQKVQYEFGSLSPAGSSVEAATTPSRWGVSGNARATPWYLTVTKK